MKKEQQYSFLEVKQKIERWCAYRDRCHQEVNQKLRDYGLDGEDTNALLAHLISYQFLDEERYAESFVSGRYKIKKWGRNKIKMHLKRKNIPSRCIDKALATIDEDQYTLHLEDLARRKWNEKKGNAFEKKVKVQRFLVQRGYEHDLIHNALDELERADEL